MSRKNIIILAVALVVLFGVLIMARLLAPQSICWPYCGQAIKNLLSR